AQTEAGRPGALVVLESHERLEQVGAAGDEALGSGPVADFLRNGVGFGEVGAGGGQRLGAHSVLALGRRLGARSRRLGSGNRRGSMHAITGWQQPAQIALLPWRRI